MYYLVMENSSSHWMQSAVIPSHKGLFGAKAKRAGMSTHSYAEEERGAAGTLGKEARLALTFEGASKHKSSPKKWTEASDDKWDKAHGVKEGSPRDMKLDASRGLPKDTPLASSLAKLGGGK